MRSSGSVIGGAINFGNNHEDGASGAIKWSTYVVFIVFGELANKSGARKMMADTSQSALAFSGRCCSVLPRKSDEGTAQSCRPPKT